MIAYIMNKNDKVLKFSIDEHNCITLKKLGKLPLDFGNLQEWIKSRARFSCARNIKEFFASVGIKSYIDYIYITHCVSLADTFWVKYEDEYIKWKDISPYRNNYSEFVSRYALEGTLKGIRNKEFYSPVLSTDGSFPHTWLFNNGNIKFIKAGSKYTLGGSNSGQEPFSEYYASKIAINLGMNAINYTIRNHNRLDGRVDIVTECSCYNSEKIGSIPASALGLSSYTDVIAYCRDLSDNAFNTILDMLFLDCLLLNTDRHFSNIEFHVNNKTLEIIDIVPIFDNNYALLPRFMEGFDTFNRMDYLARDGSKFEDLYYLVSQYKDYRNVLKSIDYKFKKLRGVDIRPTRISFLQNFLYEQIIYLLHL